MNVSRTSVVEHVEVRRDRCCPVFCDPPGITKNAGITFYAIIILRVRPISTINPAPDRFSRILSEPLW